MKKWYFSDNGNVTGPFNVSDAKSLLAKNSDLYGWNPSFSQWLPVTQILELREFITESKPAAQVPKELIDKFVTKKKDLNKKINLIDDVIKKTKVNMGLFEKEIIKYKSLTENLTPQVQENIVPIDKKYHAMVKQLKELNKATEIAKNEIIDVVQEFGELVLSKASEDSNDVLELNGLSTDKAVLKKEITTQVKENSAQSLDNSKVDKSPDINKAMDKEVEINQVETIDFELPKKDNVTVLSDAESADKINKTVPPVNTYEVSKEETKDKNSFSDVKNRLKSVFKHKTEEPPVRLSEQLKQLEQEPKEELVYIDSDIEEDDLAVNETTKKKRRRRRF